MGLDMAIYPLPIRAERRPDWERLTEALEAMSEEELICRSSDLYDRKFAGAEAYEVRERLRAVAVTARATIEQGPRELAVINVPGWVAPRFISRMFMR